MFKKIAFRLSILYLILLGIFCGLSYLSYATPVDLYEKNVDDSINSMFGKAIWTHLFFMPLCEVDYYTQYIMYSEAVTSCAMSPTEGMATNPYCHGIIDGDVLTDININDPESYSRYWHGYLFTLRLCSIFFNSRDLMIFNTSLLSFLLLFTSFLAYRRFGKSVAISYFAAILLWGFWGVPLTLQNVTCYYIMFIAISIILIQMKHTGSMTYISGLFFCIGGITSYLDFLTFPILPLAMTMAFVILGCLNRKDALMIFFVGCICWGIGYSMLWASKWLVSYMIAGPEVLKSASKAVGERSIFGFNNGLFEIKTIFCIIVTGTATMTAWWFCFHHAVRKGLPLLFVALLPYVWYAVMAQHTFIHWRLFVNRSLIVPLFLGILFTIQGYRKSSKRQLPI